MATIPMGNFGQSVARPGPVANVLSGDPVGQAAERAGQVGMQIAGDMAAQDQKLQQERQRAQAALTLAKTGNEIHDAHDEVARGVLDGSIPTDKATGEFKARVGKIQTANLDGYLPDQRQVMETHLTSTAGALDRSLGQVVQRRQQQDTAGFIDQFGEQVSREASRQGPGWAVQKFGSMVDFSGPAAGLNPEQQSRLKQSFTERVHYNFFNSAGMAALQNGDANALGELVQKVNGPDGEVIDPTKRVQLSHQLFGWQQHILAQQARAATQAEQDGRLRFNDAVDAYNKATDIALGGGYLSPEFITELTTKAAGTEMLKPVQDLIASQQTVAGFASRPATERSAILERLRSARATPGQGTDPFGEKLLQAATAMDSKLRAAADDNPWQAAQQAGVIQDAQQINAADPQSAIQVVQARMQQISRIENWTGKKVSPLQPAEVEQIGKMVRSLPVDQAASMLASFGTAIGNQERVAALGKQLSDKDGTLGLAMMYANSQTTEGRYVAELVLRGDQALKDKAVRVDPMVETGWRATIAKQVRGTFSDRTAEDAYVDAAFKIAAAKYATDGSSDIDHAVRLATGGIIEFNGSRIPLPWGMNRDGNGESKFTKAIGAITPADFSSQVPDGLVFVGKTAMPLDQFVAGLPKASLVHAGQGLYNVRAGSGLVTNAQGKRITIKVSP